MALPTNFTEFKQEVLNRAKKLEVCDAYQKVLLATDYQSLIMAGINLIVWAYQNGIVDDTLAGLIPEATLNANGIYTSGTFTLTNPVPENYLAHAGGFIALEGTDYLQEIYILKTAVVTANLTVSNASKFVVMGAGKLTLNMSDNTHAKLKVYDTAQATASLSGNAVLCFESSDQSTTKIIAQGLAVAHGNTTSAATLNYTGFGSSYGLFKAFHRSVMNIGISGLATVDTKQLNNAVVTVIEIPPPTSVKIFINFNGAPDTAYNAPSPWNNLNINPAAGISRNNFKDDAGIITTVGLTVVSAWDVGGRSVSGVNTGNNSGVYPDLVIMSGWYTISVNQTFKITGLDLISKYTLTFFGSKSSGSTNPSIYTVKGVSVSLNVLNNIKNIVEIDNLSPDPDGSLTVTLSTTTGFSFISALVITKTTIVLP